MIDNIKKIDAIYKAAREIWPDGSISELEKGRKAEVLQVLAQLTAAYKAWKVPAGVPDEKALSLIHDSTAAVLGIYKMI